MRLRVLLLCVLAAAGAAYAQFHLHPSPFLPETGKGAVERLGREIQNPAVVLSLALEPGTEDLEALAHLRIAQGARVVSAYLTNGGSVPQADRALPPLLLAANRREEAYRATAVIGVESYFFALPDAPIAADSLLLSDLWDPDTLASRVRGAILAFRPDLIVIGRDVWSGGQASFRQGYALRGVVRGLSGAKGVWDVNRVIVDSGPSEKPPELATPASREASRAATAALKEYGSLRREILIWHGANGRLYRQVYPTIGGRLRPDSFLKGLVLFGKPLSGVSASVREAVRSAKTLPWKGGLAAVTSAIDSVQRRIYLEGERLAGRDRRALVTWKLGLEQMRCVLLNVKFSIDVSDSILTNSQLFFVRIQALSARDTSGSTYLMVPAIHRERWIVNESQENSYPVTFPSEFRVVTPETLLVTSGPAGLAVQSARARLSLSVILYHDNPDRTRNFEYRFEIPLRTGSKHIFEVLSPIVRAKEGARVAYSVTNVSRDRYAGSVSIADSLVRAAPRSLLLKGKDATSVDTLSLEFTEPLPVSDYPVAIRVGPRVASGFLVRTFPLVPDTSLRVGVLTASGGGPLIEALDRMEIPGMIVRGPGDLSAACGACNVIVIEGNSLALVPDAPAMMGRLGEWVAAGGRLILFPQWLAAADLGLLTGSLSFVLDGGVDVATPIRIDSALALEPNRLRPEDTERWVISRAFGVLSIPDRSSWRVLVTDDSGRSLVAALRKGKGSVIVSALDLQSQFLNVHPGAHRLFVNLLAGRF